MNREPKFYECDNCKTIVEVLTGDNKEYTCCGTDMKEMTANTSEGAAEKHVPVTEINGNEIVVKVGSIFHPMSDEHSIIWVQLITEKGSQRVYLKSGEEPVARFVIAEGDSAVSVYAFCNLHGLWKMDI